MSQFDTDKMIADVLSRVGPCYLQDVADHGCSIGTIGSLCYYVDTVEFHDTHEAAIWDLVYSDMQSMGETDNVMAYIASWSGAKHVTDMAQLKNLLTWYAAESVCRDICDAMDADGIDTRDEDAVTAFLAARNGESYGIVYQHLDGTPRYAAPKHGEVTADKSLALTFPTFEDAREYAAEHHRHFARVEKF